MKLFSKKKFPNGRQHVYFCGIKIASYKIKNTIIGENNKISIPDGSKIRLSIYGDNNTVIVGNHKYYDNLYIRIGVPDCYCNDCTVIIGDDFSCNGATMLLLEDNTSVNIGNDCMFSDQIMMWFSDTHTVTDLNGKIINIGKSVKIGNHVWIGFGATILKNTIISDNCVIGAGSLVSGKFEKPNCAIAGNPAKIVKENINWDRRRPKQYL